MTSRDGDPVELLAARIAAVVAAPGRGSGPETLFVHADVLIGWLLHASGDGNEWAVTDWQLAGWLAAQICEGDPPAGDDAP